MGDEHTSDVLMAAYLRPFVQRFRDHRKATGVEVEYDIRLEFDRHGQPHAHLTVITASNRSEFGMKNMVRDWWASACRGRPVRVYCRRVRNAEALARYVTKNLRDRRGVLPPPDDWNGRACRLIWRSRGFLTGTKEALWKGQIAEWFPKPPIVAETVRADDSVDSTVEKAIPEPVTTFGPLTRSRTRPPRLRAGEGCPVRLCEAFGPVRWRRWHQCRQSREKIDGGDGDDDTMSFGE